MVKKVRMVKKKSDHDEKVIMDQARQNKVTKGNTTIVKNETEEKSTWWFKKKEEGKRVSMLEKVILFQQFPCLNNPINFKLLLAYFYPTIFVVLQIIVSFIIPPFTPCY